jgi:hypothetical protein
MFAAFAVHLAFSPLRSSSINLPAGLLYAAVTGISSVVSALEASLSLPGADPH